LSLIIQVPAHNPRYLKKVAGIYASQTVPSAGYVLA
jgi:hypothetical protein